MRHYLSQLSNVTYELLSVEAEYKREEEEGTEKGWKRKESVAVVMRGRRKKLLVLLFIFYTENISHKNFQNVPIFDINFFFK